MLARLATICPQKSNSCCFSSSSIQAILQTSSAHGSTAKYEFRKSEQFASSSAILGVLDHIKNRGQRKNDQLAQVAGKQATDRFAIGADDGGVAGPDLDDLPVDPRVVGILRPDMRPDDDVHRRPLPKKNATPNSNHQTQDPTQHNTIASPATR